MGSFKLYLDFYKSTIILNCAISFSLTVLLMPSFLTGLPVMLMTAGPIVCIFYKELNRKKEYFFYYNCSISKPELLFSYLVINTAAGSVLLFISAQCQTLLK